MLTGSDFTAELHLTAGLGALVLGGGSLARGPRRALNRLFALLCAALGLWNLGYGLYRTGIAPEAPWRLIFLLGSCAAAPIGLHFCLALSGRAGAARRWIGVAYGAATALYLSAWFVAPHYTSPARHAWNYAAMAVLGGICVAGLAAILVYLKSLPPGPERRALSLLFYGAFLAAFGGLSDFLPRGGHDVPRLGPVRPPGHPAPLPRRARVPGAGVDDRRRDGDRRRAAPGRGAADRRPVPADVPRWPGGSCPVRSGPGPIRSRRRWSKSAAACPWHSGRQTSGGCWRTG